MRETAGAPAGKHEADTAACEYAGNTGNIRLARDVMMRSAGRHGGKPTGGRAARQRTVVDQNEFGAPGRRGRRRRAGSTRPAWRTCRTGSI